MGTRLRCASVFAWLRRDEPARQVTMRMSMRMKLARTESDLIRPNRTFGNIRARGCIWTRSLWRSRPGCEDVLVGLDSRGGTPPEPAGEDARATISRATIFCQMAQSCYFVPHVSNQQETGA